MVQAGGPGQVVWDLYTCLFQLADQVLRSSLLFMGAGFFCRAITSSGDDMENLMAALGGNGLSEPMPQTLYPALLFVCHCFVRGDNEACCFS